MPITPINRPVTPGRKKISLPLLLDQLDREWEASQRADALFVSDDDAACLTYYHCALRVALRWIEGDYHYQFPAWYGGQRLEKVCAYLRGLEGQPAEALYPHRDKQVTLLRTTSWPAYRDRCALTGHTGTGGVPAELGYTWDGLDSLYTPDEALSGQEKVLPYLPRFHAPESEAWHCNALAVMFLNRALKLALVDLEVTPF